MGDYLKRTGAKIGTCGQAYYATLPMLQKEQLISNDEEVNYYLDPTKKCSFAFPFPDWDNKEIGDISNFHEDRTKFPIYLKEIKTFHGTITHHIHPKCAEGVNVFIPCVYAEGANVSRNLNRDQEVFYLTSQVYYDNQLMIMGECAYCGEKNVFSKEEAQIIVNEILERSDKLIKYWDNYPEDQKEQNKKQSDYLREVANRIKNTYKELTLKSI